jgi:hypothetical protein
MLPANEYFDLAGANDITKNHPTIIVNAFPGFQRNLSFVCLKHMGALGRRTNGGNHDPRHLFKACRRTLLRSA